MPAADLHPFLCLALAALCGGLAYVLAAFAWTFWLVDPHQPRATVLPARVTAASFAMIGVAAGWLAILYAVAGLYPPLAFMYRWLVL